MYEFRWNDWNVQHIAEHDVIPTEAEHVVNHPRRGFPRRGRNDSYLVWGATAAGRLLQVVYLIDPAPASTVFVIHARDLAVNEKRRLRRSR